MNLLAERYTDGKKDIWAGFSIDYALRSLGLPCSTPHLPSQPRPDLGQVAAALAHEFQRTTTRRRYLCPLDMADELPTFQFGNAKMGRFTAAELEDFSMRPGWNAAIRTFDWTLGVCPSFIGWS